MEILYLYVVNIYCKLHLYEVMYNLLCRSLSESNSYITKYVFAVVHALGPF